MTVDDCHSHVNSSIESVSTISTVIDEIALQHTHNRKEKQIAKPARNAAVWTPRDITTLVRLLKEYGCDFTMISTKMDKSRTQIKRKFKVLEKQYPHLAEVIFDKHPEGTAFTTPVGVAEVEEDDFFDE
jgi:GTP-binding protein EngB required for normal cell division